MAANLTLIQDIDVVFATWPGYLAYARQSLETMSQLDAHPRYEESWSYDIFIILAHFFPLSEPERYYIKSQYNLRAPLSLEPTSDGEVMQSSQVSIESHGVFVPGRNSGIKDVRCKPDIVVDQGIRGSQNMGLMIEIKRSNDVDASSFERFHGYCNAVRALGPAGKLANILLIAGGRVYRWRYHEIPFTQLLREDLEEMEYIHVLDPAFLRLLAEIWNDYVEALLVEALLDGN